jgi:hypothetical protein
MYMYIYFSTDYEVNTLITEVKGKYFMYMYIYIYIFTFIYIYIYICIYMF